MQKSKQNYGRTMLEMLGALAIIGILSISALYVYGVAIDSYKANIILNDARMIAGAVLQKETITTDSENVINTSEYTPETSYAMRARRYVSLKEKYQEDKRYFSIEVDDVDKGVCEAILNKVGNSYKVITVNKIDFKDQDISICNDENDKNFIEFFFDREDNPECPKPCGQDCCGANEICNSNQECVKLTADCDPFYEKAMGNVCCSKDTISVCGENCCDPEKSEYDNHGDKIGTACCGGACCYSGVCAGETCCEEGQYACGEKCYDPCDGEGMTGERDPQTCQCLCAEKDKCGNPLQVNDSGECGCPSAGYTLIDGCCKRIACYGGPTNYDCYIDGVFCGYHCNSTGHNCVQGICDSENCEEGETFELFGFLMYHYQCCKKIDGRNCCRKSATTYQCILEQPLGTCQYVSRTTPHQPISGLCDVELCNNQFGGDFILLGDANSNVGACRFTDINLVCIPYYSGNQISFWQCYKNGFLCDKTCREGNPKNCCAESACLNGMTYVTHDDGKGYCEDDVKYCTTTEGSYGQYCYAKADNKRMCLITYAGGLMSGSCRDPGCAGYKFEGETLKFGYISYHNFYGCQTADGRFMSQESPSNGGIIAYHNKQLCGKVCTLDGQNCSQVFLPQCAVKGHCPQTGYNMTENTCECDGQITTISGVQYCCPQGNTYVNRACSVCSASTRCIDENGKCVTIPKGMQKNKTTYLCEESES